MSINIRKIYRKKNEKYKKKVTMMCIIYIHDDIVSCTKVLSAFFSSFQTPMVKYDDKKNDGKKVIEAKIGFLFTYTFLCSLTYTKHNVFY